MKGEKNMITKTGFKRVFTCVLTVLMLMVPVAGCGNSTTPAPMRLRQVLIVRQISLPRRKPAEIVSLCSLTILRVRPTLR